MITEFPSNTKVDETSSTAKIATEILVFLLFMFSIFSHARSVLSYPTFIVFGKTKNCERPFKIDVSSRFYSFSCAREIEMLVLVKLSYACIWGRSGVDLPGWWA